ncbi:hypothetical protein Nepgr_006697 [Nepenthes gracilis]|uniref:Uncharacterized protein n=1 Tax=Nepenthes gracilis TaxID=150966 RepID=A0AAD3XHK1_NEPGR|nr:hypothetical protein Nepgr_006697 [Nepenthes gracilis]
MESCGVIVSLTPLHSPRLPDPSCEALSVSNLEVSKLKDETDCLSTVIELVPHSPPCEATLVAKVPDNCSSTGNKLTSHFPTVELVEHVVQNASSPMRPLSFSDVVSRGSNYPDLQSCDVLRIPISDEDRYAALGLYPSALAAVSSTSSAHLSPATSVEQNNQAPLEQLRTQNVEGSHITAAEVGGYDIPPSGPPDALLIDRI